LGTTEIKATGSKLAIRRYFSIFSTTTIIARSEINTIKQIQDGGEGIDNFPSWCLNLVAKKEYRILSKQTYVKSEWLGKKLATYLKLPYSISEIY